ncbi:MAG: hypothetical protein OWS74_01275, partial [Firmicutes bacterium]|nr:hypothetical protein [Bacillota bacterium]
SRITMQKFYQSTRQADALRHRIQQFVKILLDSTSHAQQSSGLLDKLVAHLKLRYAIATNLGTQTALTSIAMDVASCPFAAALQKATDPRLKALWPEERAWHAEAENLQNASDVDFDQWAAWKAHAATLDQNALQILRSYENDAPLNNTPALAHPLSPRSPSSEI